MSDSKFKILWQPWAGLQSKTSAWFLLIGAIILLFYPFTPFNLIPFGTSLVTLGIEFNLVKVTSAYLKGVLYLVFAVSGVLTAPTHTGSLCLLCAAITYIKAGLNGEQGVAPAPAKR